MSSSSTGLRIGDKIQYAYSPLCYDESSEVKYEIYLYQYKFEVEVQIIGISCLEEELRKGFFLIKKTDFVRDKDILVQI